MKIGFNLLCLAVSAGLIACNHERGSLPTKGSVKSVKIRVLPTPPEDLSGFDPGAYLCGLEFYETENPITETDRDGLAQLVHFLAFMALKEQSQEWSQSEIDRESLAFRALESHFGHLSGWTELSADDGDLSYRALVSFLMEPYPPHAPSNE